jgi:hypothetical protein
VFGISNETIHLSAGDTIVLVPFNPHFQAIPAVVFLQNATMGIAVLTDDDADD